MVHFPFWKNILIKTDQIKTKPLGAVFSFSPEHNGRKCSPLRLRGIIFFRTFDAYVFFVHLYSYLFGFDSGLYLHLNHTMGESAAHWRYITKTFSVLWHFSLLLLFCTFVFLFVWVWLWTCICICTTQWTEAHWGYKA